MNSQKEYFLQFSWRIGIFKTSWDFCGTEGRAKKLKELQRHQYLPTTAEFYSVGMRQ